MAKVLLKKSSVSSNAPGTGDVDYGEVAINYADGRLYYKNSSNVIKNFIDSDLIIAKITSEIEAAVVKTMTTFEYLADSGQTVFLNSDENGSILSYNPDNIIVSLNGVILRPGDDYTASNGTSLTLGTAVSLNDVLQVTSFEPFGLADAVKASTGGTFLGPITATSFTGSGVGLTGISSTNLASAQSLIIYNSAGTALKTLYGAGS